MIEFRAAQRARYERVNRPVIETDQKGDNQSQRGEEILVERIGIWVACESRSDLESRLARLAGRRTELVVTEDASAWGYMVLDDLVVPMGFANVGLQPQAVIFEGTAVIGATELVIGIDAATARQIFEYRMPTVFHEFIRADRCGLLVRDEIGFVLMSAEGKERWAWAGDDIIEEFSINRNEIAGVTFEGRKFLVRIPIQ